MVHSVATITLSHQREPSPPAMAAMTLREQFSLFGHSARTPSKLKRPRDRPYGYRIFPPSATTPDEPLDAVEKNHVQQLFVGGLPAVVDPVRLFIHIPLHAIHLPMAKMARKYIQVSREREVIRTLKYSVEASPLSRKLIHQCYEHGSTFYSFLLLVSPVLSLVSTSCAC